VLPHKGKDFELRLGKLGLTIFILGMSLALLVVFAFGVKVGKDIDSYPARIVGIIPGFHGKVLSRPEGQEQKTEAAGEKGNFKLGFYDSLSGKKADGPGDISENMQQPQAQPPGPAPAPRTEATPGAPNPAPGSSAAQVTQESAVKAEAKPESKQEAAPRKSEEKRPAEALNSEKGKYIIQVAALKSEPKARELKAKLVKLGYAPKLEAINKKGKGKVYRIRMAGYATQQDAAKVMAKLEKQIPGTKCLIHKEPE
jgi:cell division septation protein DedD